MACVAAGGADALAARRRGGVRAAAGSAQMAGQACLFALAQKEALGLQFARAAPVNTLHVLSATAHDPLPPPCNYSNGQPCFLVTTSNSSENTVGETYNGEGRR